MTRRGRAGDKKEVSETLFNAARKGELREVKSRPHHPITCLPTCSYKDDSVKSSVLNLVGGTGGTVHRCTAR